MISAEVHTNLPAFNSALVRYMRLVSLMPDEVLEKKGRDLGIRLFRGFRDRKWGGPGKAPRIATAELKARTAAGKGTKVRASLMAIYNSERAKFNKALRSIGQLSRYAKQHGTAGQIQAKAEERKMMRGLRSNLWRAIVGKEIGRRQSGIGVLAASFLWYRNRHSQARGTYQVKNRTGKPAGFVEKGDGFLRIVGNAEGLSLVNDRHGIVNTALAGATEDTLAYCRRKERAIFQVAFAS